MAFSSARAARAARMRRKTMMPTTSSATTTVKATGTRYGRVFGRKNQPAQARTMNRALRIHSHIGRLPCDRRGRPPTTDGDYLGLATSFLIASATSPAWRLTTR